MARTSFNVVCFREEDGSIRKTILSGRSKPEADAALRSAKAAGWRAFIERVEVPVTAAFRCAA